MSVLFFIPIQRKAIWGHTACRDYFHYDWFDEGVGQCWAFACQPGEGHSTVCKSEPYVGKTLTEIWNEHPEIFGYPKGDFPFIISLVGSEDDLSIQVHPDTEKAAKYGYSLGKNEAWYVIDTLCPQTSLVYGHTCESRKEMEERIAQDNWDGMFKIRQTKKGDFVYLPAGLLHALGKGHIVYEIQQATDVTFRFFDYHRKDAQGNERQLHIKDALDCVSFDPSIETQEVPPVVRQDGNLLETVFIANESFTITKHEVTGECEYVCPDYQLASVCVGSGSVNGTPISVGDNFLIPANEKVHYDGNMVILMTTKEKNR